ncbi:MAG: S-layer homology domain-containing protein [Candidatus Peribacteraceae bacterium]|nr:S-layer homology domain-containing protein [Candidatus Peribacteraceae bacterium]MDD5739564.1 S-layer homology domain-containing protein [Candidatus Peribacteraceae bacterium]
MRSSTVPIFLCVLLPSLVLASSLDDVVNDAALFDGVVKQMQDEQYGQSSDAVRESGSEVFPSTGQGSSTSRQSESEEDPTYLTARVDGVPVVFRDVPKVEWFAPYVREVTEQGIVSGYREADGTLKGLFGPADSLTIEQLAKIAVHVSQVDLLACGSTLKNAMAKGTWSESFVRCAEQRGWAVFADGSVDVRRLARRSEVVATLLQALGVKIEPRTGGIFTDIDGSVEFAAAIEMAAKAGVVAGDSDAQGNATGTFRPLDPVNRAEVAKIITMALQVYGE